MPRNNKYLENTHNSIFAEYSDVIGSVASGLVCPETKPYFQRGGTLYCKENGYIREYIILKHDENCCTIESKKAIDGGKTRKTIQAENIGRDVFFRMMDYILPPEELKKDKLYGKYLCNSNTDHRKRTHALVEEGYEPDVVLDDEKRTELDKIYHSDSLSEKEEKEFRISCPSECYARMDFDTALTPWGGTPVGHYYNKVYISKDPKYVIKDLYKKTVWQVEAGLYVRNDGEIHSGVNISTYNDSGLVVDWRSPIASMYDERKRTSKEVRSKGYNYDHSLILKRRLAPDGKFTNLYIAGDIKNKSVRSIDPFLALILAERKASHKLQDIIESIQEKQNEIIREIGVDKNIVVQGCAGSGKTMVMLHRLSVLMYNNPKIASANYEIITPNKIFDAHINELAEQIKLEKVRRRTPEEMYMDILECFDENFRKQDDVQPDSCVNEEFVSYIYSDDFAEAIERSIPEIQDRIAEETIKGMHLPDIIAVADKYLLDVPMPQIRDSDTKVQRLNKLILFEKDVVSALGMIDRISAEYNNMSGLVIKDKALIAELYENKRGTVGGKGRQKGDALSDKDLQWLSVYLTDKKRKAIFMKQMLGEEETTGFAESIVRITADTEFAYIRDLLRELKIDCKSLQKDFVSRKINAADDQADSYVDIQLNLQKKAAENRISWDAVRKYSAESGRAEYEVVQKTVAEAKTKLAHPSYKLLFDKFYERIVDKGSNAEEAGTVYKCELYAEALFCSKVLELIGSTERPAKLNDAVGKYLMIDEGQDISINEYSLIDKLFKDRVFNVFGDVHQLIKIGYGIDDWKVFDQIRNEYIFCELNENYRNTQNITMFCNRSLRRNDTPIGPEGDEIKYVTEETAVNRMREMAQSNRDDRIAVIVHSLEDSFAVNCMKRYGEDLAVNSVEKGKVSLMSVEASKGLEFDSVLVFDKNMSTNERYIAYTRALSSLSLIQTLHGGTIRARH